MTKLERQVVQQHIEGIFQNWHVCALNKRDAKAMGLKEGRLCDDCRASVKAAMGSIKRACGDE